MVERRHEESVEREFVTNAAHELQSPLTAIVSAIEVLQAGAKETPERDVFLTHIERASARLVRVVRSLLVLARAQSRAEPPKMELVPLHDVLSEVSSALTTAGGVAIEVTCPADAAALTNRELLEHAVYNVAENAAKYTADGRIELAARVLDGDVEISISDTGLGIPNREQDRVFDRFFRGETASEEGSGLGLAIARAAVEAVGGHVELESKPGEGTHVRLHLPRGARLIDP